jgi:predicted DNA-binding protein with PD1-like motif
MKLEPLRLTPGTDLLLALAALPRQRGERAGMVISGIGSLVAVQLRFAGRDGATALTGDHEILSLAGSLSLDGAHLHLSVADAEGRVTGGHLWRGPWCTPPPNCWWPGCPIAPSAAAWIRRRASGNC